MAALCLQDIPSGSKGGGGETGVNGGFRDFPGGASGKEPSCQGRRCKRRGFDPCMGKIPWRRAWQPTPVFLPGESMDRGGWRATVHRVTDSQTRLKRLSRHKPSHSVSRCPSFPHLQKVWQLSPPAMLLPPPVPEKHTCSPASPSE